LLHSSREPGELSQCSKHDDSTINIVVVIIIIIIIIIINCADDCDNTKFINLDGDLPSGFYRRARYCYGKLSVGLSVPSVCNVEVSSLSWSHRLEFLENNFTAD